MDISSPQELVKALLPKIPLMLKNTAFHTLGISETSWKWDLKQQLIITTVRSMLDGSNGPRKLSSSQRASLKDPGVIGKKWISRYTIPVSVEDDDVRNQVLGAIEAMTDGGEEYTKPDLKAVEVEWTGYRADANDKSPELDISEEEKYENLMKEVTSDVVVLYFHGGAYYLMDPATHRGTTAKLAQMTGGKTMSVRYRLAPQNPFPAALLDALVSYLSLLSPPPGAPHKPVPAKNIVFAGDSAGGNLSLVLLQLLLQLHRMAEGATPTINFHGQSVEVPLPAGVALNSPWCDLTGCMPSVERFAKYDYLPNKWDAANVLPCSIWPTSPPRVDIYAEGSALCHPLVSPLAARDWSGSPPVWFGVGEELLADEGSGVACIMARQGVKVVWEQYEAMPHCFAMIFETDGMGEMYWDHWSNFITKVVEGENVETYGQYITAKKLERKEVRVSGLLELIALRETDLRPRMEERKRRAIEEFEEMLKKASVADAKL